MAESRSKQLAILQNNILTGSLALANIHRSALILRKNYTKKKIQLLISFLQSSEMLIKYVCITIPYKLSRIDERGIIRYVIYILFGKVTHKPILLSF